MVRAAATTPSAQTKAEASANPIARAPRPSPAFVLGRWKTRALRPALPALRPLEARDADRVRRRPGPTLRSCWSASSQATRRIWRAPPSSARRHRCSTARWRRPASTAARSMSPTRSSTSSSSRAASGACTRRRTRRDPGLPLVDRAGARAGQPRLTVALGATAAHALLGRKVTIGKERGRTPPCTAARHCGSLYTPRTCFACRMRRRSAASTHASWKISPELGDGWRRAPRRELVMFGELRPAPGPSIKPLPSRREQGAAPPPSPKMTSAGRCQRRLILVHA